jgi:hypothetical protein
MDLQLNELYVLRDAQGASIGEVQVTALDDQIVRGRFLPRSAYDLYKHLFRSHEEAVNQLLLSNIDEIEDQIEAIDLKLGRLENSSRVKVYNVQITTDGRISFRLIPFVPIDPRRPAKATDE